MGQAFSSASAPETAWDGPRARIAVAGAGWWTQSAHLPQLQRNPGAEIVAIIEPCAAPRSTLNPDMKTVEALSELYGVPTFSSIDDFLESGSLAGADGIIIATAHSAHHSLGMKAIKAGLHVFMEKPMTTDAREAHELVEAASAAKTIFMVNNSANYRQQAQRAYDLVKEGAIGEVRHVGCYMGSALLWLFDDPSNEGWVKPHGTMLGNGFGWGQLSHTLAWVYMVTGLIPKEVFCCMGYSEKTGADLYDSATVRCTNGATISVQGVASLPFKSYTESSKQIENRIFGSEGLLMYCGDDKDPDSGGLVMQRHDGNHQNFPGFLFEDYSFDGDGPESLKAFIGGCVGKPFFLGADATIGMRAVQTIEAMYRSAKSGKMESVA
mmetsp:Transcript_134447/g.287640  ORF Transcript_134447/g.287640 Transcript_134447/m.287640 type:complete len:381 (-) Transcript_134447:339-1481(-)